MATNKQIQTQALLRLMRTASAPNIQQAIDYFDAEMAKMFQKSAFSWVATDLDNGIQYSWFNMPSDVLLDSPNANQDMTGVLIFSAFPNSSGVSVKASGFSELVKNDPGIDLSEKICGVDFVEATINLVSWFARHLLSLQRLSPTS